LVAVLSLVLKTVARIMTAVISLHSGRLPGNNPASNPLGQSCGIAEVMQVATKGGDKDHKKFLYQ